MLIQLQSDKSPLKVNPEYNIIESTPDSRIYIQLSPDSKQMPRRHQGELVLRNGWVHLDYDKEGFLIGLEIVEGDPFTGATEAIPYLQPVNPLLQ